MKFVNCIVEVADDRPDLLIDAAARVFAEHLNGRLRVVYTSAQPEARNVFERLLDAVGIKRGGITEIYPQHIEDASNELERKHA